MPSDEPSLVLQPLLVSRIAGLVFFPLALLPLWIVFVWNVPPSPELVLSLAVALFFGVLGVRNWRCAVILRDRSIRIRGIAWSRTIDRSAVVGPTEFSWLAWRSPSGKNRVSPLVALWVPAQAFAPFHDHAHRCLDIVRAWCNGSSVTKLRRTADR
ncbi:hypothetical protein M2152_001339 [Microbacteriaceae bacterium SG_E_30_P1]|uniref:Toxin CptA n=1 Tax=Antiquaquibacter oligotrophicus TaxID=2880260 RepID=A0ABT6KPS2_9MICO|nr:hypothetical protein [Antiquaquibacter oligotrophicus]MDH6181157.1 hypothetical protein [Antiquaquibacter oligotrophicus]UDF13147.1 hypothetical protein LH407_13445 [Antiquaquibacter oligotrophicus]